MQNYKKTEPQKKSYTYKPQYGLVIICADEAEQIKLFNQLKSQNLKLKVVTVWKLKRLIANVPDGYKIAYDVELQTLNER